MTSVDQTWPVLVSGGMEQDPNSDLRPRGLALFEIDLAWLCLCLASRALPSQSVLAYGIQANKQLTLQPPRAPVVSRGPWLRARLTGILSERDRPLSLQTQRGEPAP
jgi:hypothetical protein